MKIWKEFRDFAFRGNALDLAIGIIIGAAFGQVVTSLVNDVLMPPLGLLLGRVNFNDLYIALTRQHYQSLAAAKAASAPTINYGSFISHVISFVLVALAVFLIVRAINAWLPKKPKPAATKPCPYCCSAINAAATRCPQCTSELSV